VAKIEHTVWLNSGIGKGLTDGEARELLLISRRESYEDGDSIFSEGDPAAEFFLILEGEVHVLKQRGERKAIIASLGSGSILGEMSLLQGTDRSATAAVKGDTLVLRVKWNDFEEMLKHSPGAAFKLMHAFARVLAGRLKKINLKVAELTTSERTTDDSRLEEFANFKQKLLSDWSF
jgi:CRP-like cAMP-binding protein